MPHYFTPKTSCVTVTARSWTCSELRLILSRFDFQDKKSAALSRAPFHFLPCLQAVSSYNSLRPFDLIPPTPPSYQQTSSTNLRQTEYQPFSSPHFQFVLNSSPGVCCRNTGYANRSRITSDAVIRERRGTD